MAVNRYDPATGRPIFEDADAPDIKVDPTEVGKYAAEVGNRIVGSTSYLNGYAFLREGLAGFDTTLDRDVVYTSAGWRPTWSDTGWQGLTLSPGWTFVAGDPPEYRVLRGELRFRGRIDATTGASEFPFTNPLPVGARPDRAVPQKIGVTGGSGAEYVFNVGTDGVVRVFKGSNALLNLALAGFVPYVLS